MGAFGELLIQHWGGDLDKYRGNTPDKPKTIAVETTSTEKEQLRDVLILAKATRTLTQLTSSLIYRPQDAKNYTEEDIKNGFKQLGLDVNIQNIMWNEYCSFLDKYIK